MTITILDKKELERIKKTLPECEFRNKTYLFFEGQVPTVGTLLIDGDIQLVKKKKIIKKLTEGTLIGVGELMQNIPSQVGALINEGTKVCLFDRSSIKEFLSNGPECEISTLLSQIIKKDLSL